MLYPLGQCASLHDRLFPIIVTLPYCRTRQLTPHLQPSFGTQSTSPLLPSLPSEFQSLIISVLFAFTFGSTFLAFTYEKEHTASLFLCLPYFASKHQFLTKIVTNGHSLLCLTCKGIPLLTLHVHRAMHVVCDVSPQLRENRFRAVSKGPSPEAAE